MSSLGWAALALGMCLPVVTYIVGYRRGVRVGNRERCGRHLHAEKVAVGRLEPARHDGPPARVTTADFRHTRIEEGDDLL